MFLKNKTALKTQISTPIGKSTINSPKRVIKALYDYQGKSPNELSFKQGDFFLVTGRENDLYYYEAFNSITKSRGIVPVSYFAIVEKAAATTPVVVNKSTVMYGVVLYDFQAERSDELTAKAGEAILIIAQSNAEWYVAKPIGRLGGPGLIPISFVDIRDAMTPKQATDSYFPDVPHVVSAHIDTFILEGEQYWFIVFAKLSNGKYRVLYRLYEDFYDFQVLFLHQHPKEAGQYSSDERILPYMPGPVKLVTEEITADRARDLTRYCKELLELPKYLSNSSLVQDQLFGIHEGDIETNVNPNSKETIKVKIIYKDDIVAIKIPVSSSFEFLKGKIVNRLGFDVYLQYKSGDRLVELSREIFQQAVKLGKLTVVATYK